MKKEKNKKEYTYEEFIEQYLPSKVKEDNESEAVRIGKEIVKDVIQKTNGNHNLFNLM